VDRDHVRVVELRGGLGLAAEHLEQRGPVGRAQPVRPHELERHVAAQLGVARFVDHAEATLAEEAHDLEATDEDRLGRASCVEEAAGDGGLGLAGRERRLHHGSRP
jgi:hypothetical protein